MHATLAARAVPLIINVALIALCLFAAAGRVDWWNGWALLGLSFVTSIASSRVVWRQAGLGAERHRPQGGEKWDKLLVGCTVLLGPMATWIVAGLEVRYRGSTGLPVAAVGAGLVAAAAGGALLVWAMGTNAFFSSVARIQRDRGHTVVTGRPYAFVRHPGYAGMLLFLLGTPPILGSKAALVPAVATAALIVVRTALEDRLLQRELEGYRDYAGRVRYRLLPFVW